MVSFFVFVSAVMYAQPPAFEGEKPKGDFPPPPPAGARPAFRPGDRERQGGREKDFAGKVKESDGQGQCPVGCPEGAARGGAPDGMRPPRPDFKKNANAPGQNKGPVKSGFSGDKFREAGRDSQRGFPQGPPPERNRDGQFEGSFPPPPSPRI